MPGPSQRQRLDAAIEAYRREFGGQERATRDLSRLDEIAREVRSIMGLFERRIGPLPDGERALFEEAREWTGLFTRERAAIVAEKALPERTPERQHVSEPGGRVNTWLALLRARLHPGAKVVDLALLREVHEGLQDCERDMLARTPEPPERWMLENLAGARGSLAAVSAQEAEIARAMTAGTVGDRRAFVLQLGRDLEGLLAWEAKFVASKAQRPSRLRHASATLRTIVQRVRMFGALTGAEGDLVAQLAERADGLDVRCQELVSDRVQRPDAVVASLGAELASIHSVYKKNFADKLRTEVDLALLRRILYRASSVTLQASELARDVPSASAEAFRLRARERQGLYEREEQAVAEKQAERPRRR